MSTTNPARRILDTVIAGQQLRVTSRRASGTGLPTAQTFTVTRVAPGARMVEMDGSAGGWAALIVGDRTGKVSLLGGRAERVVVAVEIVAQVAA